MLSRTADSLYWLARELERAESIVRLLDVGIHMSSNPLAEASASEWHSTVLASGCEPGFYAKYDQATSENVIDFLIRDPDNPSSIFSCIETARQNARAVRTALTSDMWDAVNATWLDARSFQQQDFALHGVRRLLDWVKERSQLFSGAMANTMLRRDGFWFARLGTFIERADNTARILDVKYNILLPDYQSVGGTLDYYQWNAILRAVSARRSYHWIYRTRLQPWSIAELLILRPEMPRSLCSCFNEITWYLDALAEAYGTRGECHRLAGQMDARLRYGKIDEVFQIGLHEFLTEFIDFNVDLGSEISQQYNLS